MTLSRGMKRPEKQQKQGREKAVSFYDFNVIKLGKKSLILVDS